MPEARTIALTGATGFVGRHVLPQLLSRGHRVRVLARDPGKLPGSDSNVEAVRGDLFDDKALAQLVQGCDTVVHLVGIIMEKPGEGQTFERVHTEGTRRLLAAAKHAGVGRWVQMSALGARPDAVSRYHQTKWAAEEAVRASGLEWTVFRPSVIHGPDGEFMQMVHGFWTKHFPPFVPYFGSGLFGTGGAGHLQPIWVEDVATCFAEAVTSRRAVGETYPLGGPDVFTWAGFYEAVRRHLPGAKKKKILGVPAWYAGLIAGFPGVPFNKDQVIMSQEDSTCSIEKMRRDFEIEPAGLEETLAGYAAKIG